MGKTQKYRVQLSEDERRKIQSLIHNGAVSSRVMMRAHVLLKADRSQGTSLSDDEVAQALRVSTGTVQNVRERYFKEGLASIYDKPRSGRPPIIDQELEAKMLDIAASPPPDGKSEWTLRMIAVKLVEVSNLKKISHQAVHKRLKKIRDRKKD